MKALDSLAEALRMPFSLIVRDASIQRFEYTFESVWKLLKAYLGVLEGIACNSPKQCSGISRPTRISKQSRWPYTGDFQSTIG